MRMLNPLSGLVASLNSDSDNIGVGSGGCVKLSIKGTVVQSNLPPFQNLGNLVHPTFACVFWKRLKAGGPF